MAAYVLVNSGSRVIMLERGDWVERGPACWAPAAMLDLSPSYSYEAAYTVRGAGPRRAGGVFAVGGPSNFYGGVSFRLRERDFLGSPGVWGRSRAGWPFRYDELEPYYALAEQILGVAGDTTADPTDPPRSTPLRPAPTLSGPSRMIRDAARGLGLHPFHLPLAINFGGDASHPRCARCSTCDAYACAIGAKNDLSMTVLPELVRRGLQLRPNSVAVRLVAKNGRIAAVECVDRRTGRRTELHADEIIVSAGALASPHLLLASGLESLNPGGWTIGRYLMRHCNAIVYGWFPKPPNPDREFHKQIGIHDFYEGDPAVRRPAGRLGAIQQIHSPPIGMVRERLPRPAWGVAESVVHHTTGMIVIAEDQPNPENRLRLDQRRTDSFGMPVAVIRHVYSRRDLAARRTLAARAALVLKAAGAAFTFRFPITTFSHALGTVRMGEDPQTSAVDAWGAFRGIDNLHIMDASAFPSAGGVNPSLTIGATALRAAERLAGCTSWRRAVRQAGFESSMTCGRSGAASADAATTRAEVHNG